MRQGPPVHNELLELLDGQGKSRHVTNRNDKGDNCFTSDRTTVPSPREQEVSNAGKGEARCRGAGSGHGGQRALLGMRAGCRAGRSAGCEP